jgi:RHS repeat-associated protein
MTDAAAGQVEYSDYLPFGVQREHAGTSVSSYKYTDQELDASTGLYNYDARLYDPVVGRFVAADSIVPDWYDPQALNRYAYALNNPLAYIDPDGHAPADWARSWDESAAQSSAALDQMVRAHSWTWSVAAAVQTAINVGAGAVDLLKFGEGIAEGTPESVAQDLGRGGGIILTVVGAGTKLSPKGIPPKGVAPKNTPKITKDIKVRKEPGADKATSRHIIEKQGDETISVTHQVKDQSGKTIHQHQTHIGKHGTQRQFPDEWVEYPTVGE